MADVFSKSKRSQVMAAIKSRGNKATEGRMITILRSARVTGWRRGLPIPGKPDFAFPRQRVAVFIDGCFWHGCPKHCRMPKTRCSYWQPKIARNKNRDRKVAKLLRSSGWRVVRIWEHALKRPEKLLERLNAMLAKR